MIAAIADSRDSRNQLLVRDFSLLWRAIIALMLGLFGSFIAEIFRAGIQAVDQGQIEAAKALGLSSAFNASG